MIELVEVTKKFGDKVALDNVSFEIEDGELCVLLGPSGCGKTTTLRLINRLTEPSSGNILVNGENIRRLPPPLLRRGIGYAIQEVGLFPHMTIGTNVSIVPRLLKWPRERIEARVEELLQLVGLDKTYEGRYPRELSGGEAQRVGVARALAADPRILLMDEPFAAVDPLTRERLQTAFLRIQAELHKTVLFVTHDQDEAVRLADRIVIMQAGKIEQHDKPEIILDHPANKFVHDFVGTDRALKRLARFSTSDIMQTKVSTLRLDASPEEIHRAVDEKVSLYVVDTGGRLVGWAETAALLRTRNVAAALTRGDPNDIAVFEDDSLRTALSRMLSQRSRTVAVVDPQLRVVGEIDFMQVAQVLQAAEVADREMREVK